MNPFMLLILQGNHIFLKFQNYKSFYHSSTIAVEKGNNVFYSLSFFFFPSEKMRDIGGVQS